MKPYQPVPPLSTLAWVALVALAFPPLARAANDGQADLDKATELRPGAQSTGDLTDVINLCESAVKKGLNKNDTTFANDLMASALTQRGSITAAKIFGEESSPNPRLNLEGENWKTYRTEALADLDKALKLSPKQPQAQYIFAKLNLLPGGDGDKAMAALTKAVDLSDDDPAMRAKALLMRAQLRKDVRQRVADLTEALRALPNNAMLLRARGLALAEQRKWDESLADFDKSITAEPDNLVGYELKAAVLVSLKRLAEANAALEKAHKMAPKNVELLLSKAKIYIGQTNYKAAADELTRALAIDGSNLAALELRAAVYDQLGEKDKALGDVDRMLQLKSGNLDLMRMRAALLADTGKYDKAVEELEKMHKANPKDSLTALQMGMLYTTMKQYPKAIAAFDEVLGRNPDDVGALRGRGDALLNLGRRGDAITEYEKAIKLQPHDVGILNNFAWLLATAPEKKIRDGRRAVELATDACKQTDYKKDYILSTLAAAYAETGDFSTARKWAAQAVDFAEPTKDDPERKEELKRELESYKVNKPWREDLPTDLAKPPAKKPDAKKGTSEAASTDSAAKSDQKQPTKPKKSEKKKPATPDDDDV
jgi:tetratricopeptide (TPR) repeat protein